MLVMSRHYVWISATGITEEELMGELRLFLEDLNNRYEGRAFGATATGVIGNTARHIEAVLEE